MPNTENAEIDELFVIVGKDSEGNEGVAVGLSNTGHAEPLIGGRRRAPRILQLAQALANESGQELHLVKFTQKGVLASITPDVDARSLG